MLVLFFWLKMLFKNAFILNLVALVLDSNCFDSFILMFERRTKTLNQELLEHILKERLKIPFTEKRNETFWLQEITLHVKYGGCKLSLGR